MRNRKKKRTIIWVVVAILVIIAGYFSFVRPRQES